MTCPIERRWSDWWTGAVLIVCTWTLNIKRTKEIIINFRKKQPSHSTLVLDNSAVEVVKSIKLLGVEITDSLDWSFYTGSVVKRTQQCLYFLLLDEESIPSPSHPLHFLPCHCRDRADQLYLHLVWQLQGPREEVATESGENCWKDQWDFSSIHPGYRTQTLSQQSP